MKAQTGVGLAANTESGSRVFIYEVEGLRQNSATDLMTHPIRRSDSVSIVVPYNRMNQEMKRISRMGGKIVSIKQVDEAATTAETSS